MDARGRVIWQLTTGNRQPTTDEIVAVTWRSLKKTGPTVSLFCLFSLYIICADFQISFKRLRRLVPKSDRIILSRLDLSFLSRFSWAFTVCKSNNAWTRGSGGTMCRRYRVCVSCRIQ